MLFFHFRSRFFLFCFLAEHFSCCMALSEMMVLPTIVHNEMTIKPFCKCFLISLCHWIFQQTYARERHAILWYSSSHPQLRWWTMVIAITKTRKLYNFYLYLCSEIPNHHGDDDVLNRCYQTLLNLVKNTDSRDLLNCFQIVRLLRSEMSR